RPKFAAVGALDAERTITYCGGGIAGSTAAFLLTLLGAKDVALYDGSMSEWAADASLPLKTGDQPCVPGLGGTCNTFRQAAPVPVECAASAGKESRHAQATGGPSPTSPDRTVAAGMRDSGARRQAP